MEGVLNTSGQSNYHSCRQSLEGMTVHEGGNDGICGEGDSTFVCNSTTAKEDNSEPLSPSSGGDAADLSALVQSNVIAESTRTSIMNGSSFGAGSGDDSAYEMQQPPSLLTQKLTGGVSNVKSSTPCDSVANENNSNNSNNNSNGGNSAGLNDCLINSALGCSASIGELDLMSSTTPLRSKQPPPDNENEDDDLLADDFDAGAMRQNRSGSFTVVRETAIPGTPIIEDEPIVTIGDERDLMGGSATPPTRSPGLMQDSASRPLIPKAKNRRSVWTADVFSPAALSNMNGASSAANCDGAVLIPAGATDIESREYTSSTSPLLPLNTSGSATFSRSTGRMLLEAVASASCDSSSVPISGDLDQPQAGLSFHSNGSNGYENGSEENGEPIENLTSVVDIGNVNAALAVAQSSSSLSSRVTPPLEDGVVGSSADLEFMRVGSSATITKAKTPGRSPAVGLPPHMMSPAIQICPPIPPASSSPKHHANNNHLFANGNGHGNGNGNGLPTSPLDNGKGDGHIMCTTPILPAESNLPLAHINGCVAEDADRSELLARISQLELENSMLKSKFSKFEEINNHLVVSCTQLGNGPHPSDLEEFHKFVKARLLAAEEVSDDYRALEHSFNELHRRYERARAILQESQTRDRQLQADLVSMKQAATVADQRVSSLMRDFETKLADLENTNASLQDTLSTEALKSELKIGQMEIESRNLQQQLQQKDVQIADLNRLLASAMTSTARRG